MPFVELGLDRRGDRTSHPRRHGEPVVVARRTAQGDDEEAVLLAQHRGVETVVEHGIVHPGEPTAPLFHDPKGAAIQKLTFPTTKDVHYRAPCLFTDTEFITATVDGRVLFYTLR